MKKILIAPVVLILLVFITYFYTLPFAFVSDDITAILQNPRLGDLSYIFERPLSSPRLILFFFAYKLGGLNPIFFRMINVFFHAGTVVVLYFLLAKFNKYVSQTSAFFIAALFAIHPIITESVTWISGGSSQNGFFVLLSFYLYIQYIQSKNRKFFLIGSLVSFLFLLGSPQYAITLVATVTLYELLFGNINSNYKKLITFWILLCVSGVAYISQINQRIIGLSIMSGSTVGIDNIFVKIPTAITTYLQLIIWPQNLTLYHNYFVMSPLHFAIRLLVFLFFISSWIISYKKNKFIFFWLSFFIFSLILTLTPLRITWTVAERYVYLGSAAIIIASIYLLDILFKKIKMQMYLPFILIVIIGFFFTRTVVRNLEWKSEDILWLATVKVSTMSPNAYNNIGDVYSRHGQLNLALDAFIKAIKLDPQYADAYHNAAVVFEQKKDFNNALLYYKKAAVLNPNLWQSYQAIATLYFKQKQYDTALLYMQKTAKIAPPNSQIYTNLGITYYYMNQKERAKDYFVKALKIDPKDTRAQAGLQKISDN